jgi:hypothetical protein
MMPPASRTPPGRGVILGAGAAVVFVVLIGADFYSGETPAFADIVGYMLISAILSPLGAAAVAMKAGWTKQGAPSRVPAVVVVLIVVGMIVALVVGQTAGE